MARSATILARARRRVTAWIVMVPRGAPIFPHATATGGKAQHRENAAASKNSLVHGPTLKLETCRRRSRAGIDSLITHVKIDSS